MKYRITIEVAEEIKENYQSYNDVYQQTIESDNGIVKAIALTVIEYEPHQLKLVNESLKKSDEMNARLK